MRLYHDFYRKNYILLQSRVVVAYGCLFLDLRYNCNKCTQVAHTEILLILRRKYKPKIPPLLVSLPQISYSLMNCHQWLQLTVTGRCMLEYSLFNPFLNNFVAKIHNNSGMCKEIVKKYHLLFTKVCLICLVYRYL